MSNVLVYTTATGYGKKYLLSVNTPDYLNPIGADSFLVDPAVSALASVPVKYWKVTGSTVSEMSQAEKDAIDDAETEARSILDYPVFTFLPHNISVCDNADWPVNGAALIENDPLNAAIKVMRFSNAAEKGIGFSFIVPSGIKKLLVSVWYRADGAPGSGKTIKTRLYSRDIVNGGAVSAWRTNALDDVNAANDTNFHKFQLSKKISVLGCTEGYLTQFQFTRRGANDTLGVDMLINRIMIKFK
jgi:hypothetical protein